MHGMGRAGPRVLLYKLTGVTEEVAMHSFVIIHNDLIFGYMIS